jgi:hypothetical protein
MDADTKNYLEERFTSIDAQFGRMASKEDLVALQPRMDTKMNGLETRMATKEDLVLLKSEFSEGLGEVAHSVSALATHMAGRFDELMPFKRDVASHENRIKYLEDKVLKAA